jgi:hypothetical protein
MHAIFFAYGHRMWVENFLRELEAQKHWLMMKDKKGKEYKIITKGSIRLLPFGAYEYIFPETDKDAVLTSLNFDKADRYKLGKSKFWMLRKLFMCEKIPKFEKTLNYGWIHDFVEIVPIGVRYDVKDFVDNTPGQYQGWTHEAL